MKCPFCSQVDFVESPISTKYLDKIYNFFECKECKSLLCSPMPDSDTLTRMYGTSYFEGEPHHHNWVADYLKDKPTGTFIDYGGFAQKLPFAQ